LYTFAEEFAYSGGYYLLCIGNEVYADGSSIVGGIGAMGKI